MKKLFLSIIFITISTVAITQDYNLRNNIYMKNNALLALNKSDNIVHSGFYPIRDGYFNKLAVPDYETMVSDRLNFAKKMPFNWFWRKLLAEYIVDIKKKDLNIIYFPVFDYYKVRTDDTNTYSQNSRGFVVKGTLGKRLSFYSDFYENQAYFLPYIDEVVKKNLIIPGQGPWKKFGKNYRGRDYNYATGYLSYTPFKILTIQLGQSKHFVGAGYRSLLLSDNTYSYPFLKMTITKNKWQYTTMFTEFQSFNSAYYYYHYKKHGTFTYLNYVPTKNIEIGLFEGIIWRTSDDSTYVKKFPFLYFVPIPGVRESFYGLNNKHNIILGLNTRVNFLDYIEMYGQFALDDFGKKNFSKRYAFQVGTKIYDLAFGKIKRFKLFLQAEYNFATPYSYTHSIVNQAYTHYNAPLAHPLGAGFSEFYGNAYLRFYGFMLTYKFNNILTSRDIAKSNFGTNILLSNVDADFAETKNFIGQGNKTKIVYHALELAYIINPRTNFQLFISATKRNYLSEITKNELFFVSFGIKNSLNNYYFDF